MAISLIVVTGCSRDAPDVPIREPAPVVQATASAATERCDLSIQSDSADVVLEPGEPNAPAIIDETNPAEVSFEKKGTARSLRVYSKARQNVVSNPGRIRVKLPPGCDVDVETMSGMVEVSGVSGEVLKVATMSGDIVASVVGSTRSLLKSMSGNIRVAAPITSGTHDVRSMSGNVTVLPATGSSAKLSIASEKAVASLNARIVRRGKVDGVMGAGAATINASTMSGDAESRY